MDVTAIDPGELERSGVAGTRFFASLKASPLLWADRATALVELADHLFLLGHAQEGLTALRIARRYNPFIPETLDRITSIESDGATADRAAARPEELIRSYGVNDNVRVGRRYRPYQGAGFFAASERQEAWPVVVPLDLALKTMPGPVLSLIGAHPTSAPGYESGIGFISGGHVDDLSFVLTRGRKALAVVYCGIRVDQTLSRHGTPIEVLVGPDAIAEECAAVNRTIVPVLLCLARRFGAGGVMLGTRPGSVEEIAYRKSLTRCWFAEEIYSRLAIDLALDEKVLWSGLRDSYRSLIRRAEERFTITVLTRLGGYRQALLDLLRISAPGLNPGYLDYFMAATGEGRAEFSVLGEQQQDRTWRGLTVVATAGSCAHYALGGYDRRVGNNIGHHLVWQAILRARKRGASFFLLSGWDEPNISFNHQFEVERRSQKGEDVLFFKSGFTGLVQRQWVFKIKL